jgi:hypothetical protein
MNPIQDRIFSKSIPEPNSGCWLWTDAVLDGGYGIISHEKKCVTAHRLSYRAFKGEIPENMVVAHKCDVRSCVNPDHLWLASHKENSEDMVYKKRSARGEACGKSKLTQEQVDFVRSSNLSQRALGRMFGVSHANIGAIKRGLTWIAH